MMEKEEIKKQSKLRGWMTGAALFLIGVLIWRGWSYLDTPRETNQAITVNLLISMNNDLGNKARYESYIDSFNQEHKQIQIKPYYVTSDTHAMLKLIYSKEANLNYDIALMGADQMVSLLDMDLLVPMDKYVLQDKGLGWLQTIRPIMMADSMEDGQLFSLPFTRNVSVVYYNKDKVTINGGTLDLYQLLGEGKKLYEKNGSPRVMAGVEEILLDAFTYQQPYTATEHFQMNTIEKVELLELYYQARQDQYLIDYSSLNGVRSYQPFIEGEADILIGNSAYYEELQEDLNFPLGAVPLELFQDISFPLQGNNLYLLKRSDRSDYDAVWSVMEAMIDYGAPKGNLSILKEPKQEDKSLVPIFNYDYNNYSGLTVPQNSKIRRLIEIMIKNHLKNGGDAKESLDQLQDQIDSILTNKQG
ncbi:MAG TPA: extracellular solute-binding protein [Candidatus Pelethocola excrementipullorum]|nr:extracellular solute-binding protein [Candidatus Pelethocola excrementipullorum]